MPEGLHHSPYGYGYGYSGYITHPKSGLRKFDWGLTVGLGLEIKQWVVNFGYDLSMGKEYNWDDIGAKYHTFSLTVGYKFKLGK